MTTGKITFEVTKTKIKGDNDYRVNKYLDGKWVNQADGNFSKLEAEKKAKYYRAKTKAGYPTMTDNF